MAWPADKRFMTPDQFKAHVDALDFTSWKPIGIVWHNTAEPNLKRWHDYPRLHWMTNLESYYKGLGWNGGPHLFCDDGPDGIGLFNPLNRRGTHSPSFNAQYIGIEHVGDYNVEDDDSGAGLKVKTNGIVATAILCARLGIPVDAEHIKLHKEDPRTDHDCPGKHMAQDKMKSIESVLEYMGTAGDHGPDWNHVADTPTGPKPPNTRIAIVDVDGLNIRSTSSPSGIIIGVLNKGDEVKIVSLAMNGASKWACIERPNSSVGWVNAKYLVNPIMVGEPLDRPYDKPVAIAMPYEPDVPNDFPLPKPPSDFKDVVFKAEGKMSTFGGPKDTGMSATEGLALYGSPAAFTKAGIGDWLLSAKEAGASGLGRRLDPEKFDLAWRWDYKITKAAFLRIAMIRVTNPKNGKMQVARAVDWGPNAKTGRAADLSPGLAKALGLNTDAECIVEVFGEV